MCNRKWNRSQPRLAFSLADVCCRGSRTTVLSVYQFMLPKDFGHLHYILSQLYLALGLSTEARTAERQRRFEMMILSWAVHLDENKLFKALLQLPCVMAQYEVLCLVLVLSLFSLSYYSSSVMGFSSITNVQCAWYHLRSTFSRQDGVQHERQSFSISQQLLWSSFERVTSDVLARGLEDFLYSVAYCEIQSFSLYIGTAFIWKTVETKRSENADGDKTAITTSFMGCDCWTREVLALV